MNYNDSESDSDEEVNKMDKQAVCMCADGAHIDLEAGWLPKSGDSYTNPPTEAPWERDGLTFCARGYKSDHIAERDLWQTAEFGTTDVVGGVADYYLLDAIVSGVVNMPPPVLVADDKAVSDTAKFFLGQKWRVCCDTQEMNEAGGQAPHAPGCKPINRPINLVTHNPAVGAWTEVDTRRVMMAIAKRESIPATHATVRARAHLRHVALVDRLADVFRRYLHYAISGELSHMGTLSRGFDLSYTGMHVGWFGFVMTVGGAKAAAYAKELFDMPGWHGAYGGEKWANIADVLFQYESGAFPAWLFVDRVFTLQHNTATVFNKAEFADNPQTGWSAFTMHTPGGVLDAHANSDWGTLGVCASEDVQQLFKDIWTLNNNVMVRAGGDPVDMPAFQKPKMCLASVCAFKTNNANGYCHIHQELAPGCHCFDCTPSLYCPDCKEKFGGGKKYEGKCEKCAKTANCGYCGKAILPFYPNTTNPKVLCDAHKEMADKVGTPEAAAAKAATKSTWTISGGVSVAAALHQPMPKAKPKKKPAMAKIKSHQSTFQGGGGLTPAQKLKAAMAANGDKPFVGKADGDDE